MLQMKRAFEKTFSNTSILILVFLKINLIITTSSHSTSSQFDIYKNITSICPKRELCDYQEDGIDRGCQCDEQCSFYQDCCRDSPYFVPSEPKTNFTCVPLAIAFQRDITIKMITSCPPNASFEEQRLCGTLNETMPLLSLVPITVSDSNVTVIYRNVFCARCNNVSNANYDLWSSTLVCEGPQENKTFPEGAKAVWNAEKSRWTYLEGNRTFECHLKLIRPHNLRSIGNDVDCPTTDNYVDKCPDNWTDSAVSQLCKSYSGVLESDDGQTLYKNQHCLECNGGDPEDIWCGTDGPFSPRFGNEGVFSRGYLYSVLLNINNNGCQPGESYDPISDKCERLFPPRLIHRYIEAAPIDVCATKKLRSYTLSPDKLTVTISEYDKNFTAGHFRLTEDGDVEICVNEIPTEPQTVLSIIIVFVTMVGLALSIIFLVLHLLAVILVAQLRNLSGITMASLCVALLGVYICFTLGIFLKTKHYLWCYACAIATYYFLMASFFWTLVIAFDVSKVLRASVREFRATQGFRRKQFTAYSIVAWGIPLVLGLTAHLVEKASVGSVNDYFRPNFALQSCWFGNPRSLLVFFLIPLGVIMALNLGFFIYVAMVTSENPSGKRKILRIHVKLTILLGLTWIVGILASAFDNEFLLIIFSFLNCFQGLFIFLSFTLTPKVIHGLSGTIPGLKKLYPSTTESSQQRTSTRTSSKTMSSRDD